MPGFIRAIVVATLFQVVVMTGLIIFMSNHADNVTQQYARITLESAKSYTDARILELSTKVASDRAADRAVFELYLDRAIDQKLSREGIRH